MKLLRRSLRADNGFTLIEVMASLLIFSIMTIGVAPLLATSMRGATRSRAATVGKNITLETMERIRGLPYFVEYQSSGQKRVDVLDLYFPNASDAGYNATTKTYTTTCSGASLNPACPRDLLDGYTITVVAKFVEPNSTGGYDDVTPSPAYRWDPTTPNQDFPPSQLLDLTVTGAWVVGARADDYSLQSLISDKSFLGDRIRGNAKVDYGVKVVTTFQNSAGNKDELTAIAGTAESAIESRLLSTADQLVRAGRLHLVRLGTDTQNAVDLQTLEGATSLLHAPPDATAGTVNEGFRLMQYQQDALTTLNIAGFDSTRASNVAAGVVNELPYARGEFSYVVDVGEEDGGEPGGQSDFWVNNQPDTSTTSALRLDPLSGQLVTVRATGGSTLRGSTSATTTATDSVDPNVTTTATASFRKFRLFRALLPVTARDVIRIDDFTATVTCKSTALGTSPAATAVWSATLSYWRESANDGLHSGAYASVTLGSAATSDPLVGIGRSNNPLVYDGATALDDVYLFADSATGRRGYLQSWNSAFDPATSVGEGGEVTSAGINTAIFIHTSPTNATLPDSGLKISIGDLGCDAVDRRE